jgi:hypothetical protein
LGACKPGFFIVWELREKFVECAHRGFLACVAIASTWFESSFQ